MTGREHLRERPCKHANRGAADRGFQCRRHTQGCKQALRSGYRHHQGDADQRGERRDKKHQWKLILPNGDGVGRYRDGSGMVAQLLSNHGSRQCTHHHGSNRCHGITAEDELECIKGAGEGRIEGRRYTARRAASDKDAQIVATQTENFACSRS